jgi:hypothetical protein
MGYREKITARIIKLCKIAANESDNAQATDRRPPGLSLDASGYWRPVHTGTPWYRRNLPQQEGPGLLSSPAFDVRTYADPIAQGISSGFRGFHRYFGRYANVPFWGKYQWWSKAPDEDEYGHALTDYIAGLGILWGAAGVFPTLAIYANERKNIKEYNRKLWEANARYRQFLEGDFSYDYINKAFYATQGFLARTLFDPNGQVRLRLDNLKNLDPLATTKDGKLVLPSLKPALQLLALEIMEEKHSKTFKNNPDAQNRFKQYIDDVRKGICASNFEVLKNLEDQYIKQKFDKMMKNVKNEVAKGNSAEFSFLALVMKTKRYRLRGPDGQPELASAATPTFVKVTYTGKDKLDIKDLNTDEAGTLIKYFDSRYKNAQDALNDLRDNVKDQRAIRRINDLRRTVERVQYRIAQAEKKGNVNELADIIMNDHENIYKKAMELRKIVLPELQKNGSSAGLAALNRAIWDLSSPIVEHRGARILTLDGDVARSLNMREYPAIRSNSLDVAALEGTKRMSEFMKEHVNVRARPLRPIRIRGR